MIRSVKDSQLTVVTVILAEVGSESQVSPSMLCKDQAAIDRYKQKVGPNLSSLDMLVQEGDEVELLK
jgi:hypothetical protein